MAVQADIVQMKNKEGKKQYPITSTNAIGMSDGSGNLDHVLDDMRTQIDDITDNYKEVEVNDTGIAPTDPGRLIWADMKDDHEGVKIVEEAENDDRIYARMNQKWRDITSAVSNAADHGGEHGMAYKVIPFGDGILTQDVFNSTNTIYEIRYNFELNNKSITIPTKSTLRYNGGSLNNGTLIYQDTIIEGNEKLTNIETPGNATFLKNPLLNEDDLQFVDNKLQFADRPSTSGMAYKILRKDKTFKEQVEGEENSNTIFEIRYDFDLKTDEVIIPEKCILKFEGGRLVNGKIKSKNLAIIPNGDILTNYITSNMDVIWRDGQSFFDTSLGFLKWRFGDKWVDSNGNPLDAITEGNTGHEPKDVKPGFLYRNTQINKLEIFNGTTWTIMGDL